MTSGAGSGGSTITFSDEPFDIDTIEVDELIESATQLLNEVYRNQPRPVTATPNQRDDAMQQVQRFLNSIREPESPQDDDVVFVEARAGNALPSNARTTAIVDLCTPVGENSPPTTRRRGRRSASALAPQALFQDSTAPDCSNIPTKTRRRQPKKEPNTATEPTVTINDSVSSAEGGANTSSPDGGVLPRLMCAVCMESVVNRQPSSTACGHIFCQKCILQAIRLTKKCPLCNSKLKRAQVHRVYF